MDRGVNKIILISFLVIVLALNGFSSVPGVFCLLMLLVIGGNTNTGKGAIYRTKKSTPTPPAQKEPLQDKHYPADSF